MIGQQKEKCVLHTLSVFEKDGEGALKVKEESRENTFSVRRAVHTISDRMYVCTHECMYVYVRMYVRTYVWMYCIVLYGWMDGWMDGNACALISAKLKPERDDTSTPFAEMNAEICPRSRFPLHSPSSEARA